MTPKRKPPLIQPNPAPPRKKMQKAKKNIHPSNPAPDSSKTATRRAMLPGSFDPFTRGHQSLVERGLQLFDAVVIAVGISTKKTVTEEEIVERLAPIRALYADEPRIEVTHYTGLTVDAARNAGCSFLLRGIRNAIDMEYERSLADVNRRISGIETIFLFTLPELSAISSSMVRELERYGHDVDDFMPVTPQ